MAVHTVTDDLLRSNRAAAYFTTADRRVMIGLRAALEMLGIPIPDYAARKPSGRPGARDIIAAHAADNPQPAPAPLTYNRKPDASPARVAAAKARRAN